MRYQSFYPFSNQPPQPAMKPGPPPSPFGMPFPQGMSGNPGGQPGMRNSGGPNMRPQQQLQQQQTGAQGTGPSRADQYMQTANRFLNTAQQFAPLVQQFAPLVQNLPAMWRLYKGVQSMPDVPPASSPARPGGPAAPGPANSEVINRPSSPRIFQPPF
ncbi:hypothetical protein SporoP37_00040 [Sporosarcina sp. P37]|uniref:VrrA/YqfQ family protein n=1 Tax=unclassified Sporosarcina TaxID=2647733 RepID=UPI000A17CF12|nr:MULTISPECIES: VrrA/YqfQ family protein [unclassified Sporosarcina]ARK23231.1 hypothetical protein SporoP37_00040 [Sporosarcina sp. P37]PID19483.1 hypothetical protein CSV62_02990 [Sporosarcina sp. P35]